MTWCSRPRRAAPPSTPQDTVAFSTQTRVRARIEKFPLEKAEKAFAQVMANRVRFRAVLVP